MMACFARSGTSVGRNCPVRLWTAFKIGGRTANLIPIFNGSATSEPAPTLMGRSAQRWRFSTNALFRRARSSNCTLLQAVRPFFLGCKPPSPDETMPAARNITIPTGVPWQLRPLSLSMVSETVRRFRARRRRRSPIRPRPTANGGVIIILVATNNYGVATKQLFVHLFPGMAHRRFLATIIDGHPRVLAGASPTLRHHRFPCAQPIRLSCGRSKWPSPS